jgi:hypothetical protein
VDEQPARRLGDVLADEQDADAEDGAEAEGDPPADVLGEVVLVQQEDRRGCTEGGAEPERAVDHQVDPATDPGRDQLVDRGVDGGVLATDAGTGEEPADEEPHRVHREGGEDSGHQVQRQRDHEQLLPTEPVGQVAEEQGPEAGARHVDTGCDADLALRDGDAGPLLGQPAGDRADDGDLEPVEDPHRAEPSTTSQCQRDQGSRSIRAGMLVLMVPV